jgi:hypothetical protein
MAHEAESFLRSYDFLMTSNNSRIFWNRKVTVLNVCYSVLSVLISYTEAVSTVQSLPKDGKMDLNEEQTKIR